MAREDDTRGMPKQKPKTVVNQEIASKLDRLPSIERLIGIIKKSVGSIADFYGFERIQPSLLDSAKAYTALVKAGFLEDYPPVSLKNRMGEIVTLRPTGMLGVLRTYSLHRLNDQPHPLKFLVEGESFYVSDEKDGIGIDSRPELSLVMIGEEEPIADAEIIQIIWKSLEELRVDLASLQIRVNAMGCAGCYVSYRSALSAHFRSRVSKLCKNCKKDLKGNSTNIFFCAEEKCKMIASNAPSILDFLCDLCKKYLRGFLEFLDEIGVPYFLDSRFFRIGSYYNTLIFEILVSVKGTEDGVAKNGTVAVIEGGRVSKAAEVLTGRRLDAVVGTIFLDALESHIFHQGSIGSTPDKPRVFLTQLGELAKRKSLGLLEILRKGGIEVKESLGRDAIKSQLKVAEHVGAEIALILGQKEALDKTVIVRDIDSGIQEVVSQDKLTDFLHRKLQK